MEIIILPITQPIRWVNLITSDQKQEIAASSKQQNTKCTRNTTWGSGLLGYKIL